MVVATEALDTGIKASDYMIINGCTTVMIKKDFSGRSEDRTRDGTTEIELSDSQAPCKTREGKPCKKSRSVVKQNVSSSPRESSYRPLSPPLPPPLPPSLQCLEELF